MSHPQDKPHAEAVAKMESDRRKVAGKHAISAAQAVGEPHKKPRDAVRLFERMTREEQDALLAAAAEAKEKLRTSKVRAVIEHAMKRLQGNPQSKIENPKSP